MLETGLMSFKKSLGFEAWFKKEIGTDYEKNQDDINSFYFVCLDLEEDEEYEAIEQWQIKNNVTPI